MYSEELQLTDKLPNELIDLCNYFCTKEYDENFKEAFSNNKKNTAMKTIKGTYRDNNYFEYEVNGKKYWVQGELYWNKKRNRLEHTHTGPRGGEYLIYWNF